MALQLARSIYKGMLSASKVNFERYFEPVFQPVSFDLEAGQLLLVTGANGCGKTTLIRVLARRDPGLEVTRALMGDSDPDTLAEMEAWLERLR